MNTRSRTRAEDQQQQDTASTPSPAAVATDTNQHTDNAALADNGSMNNDNDDTAIAAAAASSNNTTTRTVTLSLGFPTNDNNDRTITLSNSGAATTDEESTLRALGHHLPYLSFENYKYEFLSEKKKVRVRAMTLVCGRAKYGNVWYSSRQWYRKNDENNKQAKIEECRCKGTLYVLVSKFENRDVACLLHPHECGGGIGNNAAAGDGGGGEGGGIDGAQFNNGSNNGSGGGGSNIGIRFNQDRVAQLDEELQAMNDENQRLYEDNQQLRRRIEMLEATIEALQVEGDQPQDPPNDNDYGKTDLYDDNDNDADLGVEDGNKYSHNDSEGDDDDYDDNDNDADLGVEDGNKYGHNDSEGDDDDNDDKLRADAAATKTPRSSHSDPFTSYDMTPFTSSSESNHDDEEYEYEPRPYKTGKQPWSASDRPSWMASKSDDEVEETGTIAATTTPSRPATFLQSYPMAPLLKRSLNEWEDEEKSKVCSHLRFSGSNVNEEEE
jgi:hypothetical protein